MLLEYIYSKLFARLHGRSIMGSNINKSAVVYWGCNIVNSTIERYSYVCHDCEIVNTEIGAFCSISDKVYIGGDEHPASWVSTSPVFQNVKHSGPTKRFSKHELPKRPLTKIGNDVWIGHGVTIKAGVTIGDGAIIGSNAMVTKDVPPYSIVAGVPAKVIRFRFDDNIIQMLLKSEWWKLSDTDISKCAKYIHDPAIFCQTIEKINRDSSDTESVVNQN